MVYNWTMDEPQVFHPELTSRRGELIAWSVTLLVGIAWILLLTSGQEVHFAVPFLAVALLLAALSISLGNWMDRRTLLRIDDAGIAFRNGLRDVHLAWERIKGLQVLPARWGRKVQIVGEEANGQPAHFDFLTLGEVKVLGEVKGRVGFREGDRILEQVLKRSDLHLVEKENAGSAAQNKSYYYARD